MYLIGAHELVTRPSAAGVLATASGTVAATYDANDLVNMDPHDPIRNPGSLSITATGQAISGVNCVVNSHSNFAAGITVGFSGIGSLVTPTVPSNRIPLNGFAFVTATGSVSGFTYTATGSGVGGTTDLIVGEALAGVARLVRTLPPGGTFSFLGYGTPPPGKFGGMSYGHGVEARRYGGRVLMDDTMVAYMTEAFRAADGNSLPTVLIVNPSINDAWTVVWEKYDPIPLHPDLWGVEVTWVEIPRVRWPA